METATIPNKKNYEVIVLLISAVLITQVLFFIDEGYYDFRWMKSIGNWIMYFVYLLFILIGQLVFSVILLKKLPQKSKLTLSIFAGMVLGITALIILLYTIR